MANKLDAGGVVAQWSRRIMLLALVVAAYGCASPPPRTPLPAELTNEAIVADLPEARFWGDEWPKWSLERFESLTVEQMQREFGAIYAKPHHYLAISGGGANGAFGAGLLAGWTKSGARPEFTMVTGVSTGALIAPFAFLGPDYDDELKTVYTTTSTDDIVDEKGLLAAAFGDSVADTGPMRELLARYFNVEVIEAIGAQHARGRRLFVGTMNLDAGRAVIWNISGIAASDYPQKVQLIHDVLRASASIPVAFPPVLIDVEANGETYDELHVDGGTASQVFVYPAAIDWQKIVAKLEAQGQPRVYVIRNAFLEADHRGVKRRVFPIAARSIDSLIRTQGIGDLYQIYALCKRDNNDFNLAYIPPEFTAEPAEGFDPVYMSALFDYGFELAREGYSWKKDPPGFVLEETGK